MVVWLVLILLIVLVILLLSLPLSLAVHASYRNQVFEFSLKLHYLRVIQHTFRSGRPDSSTAHPTESQSPIPAEQQPGLIEQFDRLMDLLPDVRARIVDFHMKSLRWESTIGLGDAAHTAVISGLGWTVKGLVMGILTDWFAFDCHPELSIVPVYGDLALTTEATCILRCPLGKAMWAGWRLYRLLRSEKGRDAHANGRASNRFPDANGDGESERDGGREHHYRRSS
ncbi:MAG: DUF2953 domain-containing protein [Firmicutes bacterium]|nr:DUF2953 domain-containing protein [Bacillota bacterium]